MISQYLGFDSDYIIIGLAALVFILIILMIINVVQRIKVERFVMNMQKKIKE